MFLHISVKRDRDMSKIIALYLPMTSEVRYM